MHFKNRSQQAAVMANLNAHIRKIGNKYYLYKSVRVKGKPYPVSKYLGKVKNPPQSEEPAQ